MKTEFRVTAKTVSEAYTKAIELYSPLGEISYEIVTEGKRGFLGIFGRVDAVIKVTVDDGKEERKPKNQTQGAPKLNEKPKANQNAQANPQNKSNQPKSEKPKAEKQSNQPKSAPVKVEPKPMPKAEPKAEKTEVKEAVKEENINVTAQEKTLAVNFLKSFINDIGIKCEVKGDMTLNENGFVSRLITIEGEDAPSLIGHRGDMLDALQYLANLCLARKSDSDHKEYVKVIVDIENYRAKREETLRALARKMAQKVLKYKKSVMLEPMNPYERRIIHSEIQNMEGVSTNSIGSENNRKIVIFLDSQD